MRDNQAEMRVTFSEPMMAARFVRQCHHDGHASERAGENVVTVIAHSHREEAIVVGLAEAFRGHATMQVPQGDR